MNGRLDWMDQAACAAQPGLPWTADPGTYPELLADLMAEACSICPVHAACDTYANDSVTAGFWAGTPRQTDNATKPGSNDDEADPSDFEAQPTLPFEDAAA